VSVVIKSEPVEADEAGGGDLRVKLIYSDTTEAGMMSSLKHFKMP
jgi:hypothetical protein